MVMCFWTFCHATQEKNDDEVTHCLLKHLFAIASPSILNPHTSHHFGSIGDISIHFLYHNVTHSHKKLQRTTVLALSFKSHLQKGAIAENCMIHELVYRKKKKLQEQFIT